MNGSRSQPRANRRVSFRVQGTDQYAMAAQDTLILPPRTFAERRGRANWIPDQEVLSPYIGPHILSEVDLEVLLSSARCYAASHYMA